MSLITLNYEIADGVENVKLSKYNYLLDGHKKLYEWYVVNASSNCYRYAIHCEHNNIDFRIREIREVAKYKLVTERDRIQASIDALTAPIPSVCSDGKCV